MITAYQVRQLKNRIKDLELICEAAGVPYLIVHFPQLVLKKYQHKPTKAEMKWAKEKIAEFESKFPDHKIKLP